MESIQLDPLMEFFAAIRSPLTKDRYEHRFDIFLRYINAEGEDLRRRASSFAAKAKQDEAWATYQINRYMEYQKGRAVKGEIAESTLANFWKPIKLFTEQNDIMLNWRKITRRVPTGRNYADDRSPTLEEITSILRYNDPRIKAVVLAMISSGIRVGAWDFLHWEDIKPIEKNGSICAASLIVYSHTKDEYRTFLTLEAYNAVKTWIDSRIAAGEKVTGKSWVMRDLWEDRVTKKGAVQQRGIPSAPRKLGALGVTRLIQRALFAQGIRTKLEEGKKRYEFQTCHGLRKFFNTVCDRHMKTLYVEFLMGHNTGLKESYNRAQEDELLSEYLKAARELTILEPRAQIVNEDVHLMREQLEASDDKTRALEEELTRMRKEQAEDREMFVSAMKQLGVKFKNIRELASK